MLALPSDVTTYTAPDRVNKKNAYVSMKLSQLIRITMTRLHEENYTKLHQAFPVAMLVHFGQTTLTPHTYHYTDVTGRGEGKIVLRVTHQTREGTDGEA